MFGPTLETLQGAVASAAGELPQPSWDAAAYAAILGEYSKWLNGAKSYHVRALGLHLLTADAVRLTQVLSPPAQPGSTIGLYDCVRVSDTYRMLAYRQVFGEANTINAWLLRSHATYSSVALNISNVDHGHNNAHVFFLSPTIASLICPDWLVTAIETEVQDAVAGTKDATDWSQRAQHAAQLYKRLQKISAPTISDNVALENAERFQAHLHKQFPHLAVPDRADALRMLQSTMCYTMLYGAKHFHTRFQAVGGRICGLTLLCDASWDNNHYSEFESGSQRLKRVLEYKPAIIVPAQGRVHADQPRWIGTVLATSGLPRAALQLFRGLVEELAHTRVEGRSPNVAVVMASGSALEATGLVRVEDVPLGMGRHDIADVVDLKPPIDEASLQASAMEDCKKLWPLDVVVYHDAAACGSDSAYLQHMAAFPQRSHGFHVLDLDPTYHLNDQDPANTRPRRLRQGSVGWWAHDSRTARVADTDAYVRLTQSIKRCIVAIFDSGQGVRILHAGRVLARMRTRAWEDYDREFATQVINGKCPYGLMHNKDALMALLNVFETLSHSSSKGALILLPPNREAWETSRLLKERMLIDTLAYSFALPNQAARPLGDARYRSLFMAMAQIDGATVLTQEGEFLAYGLQIAVPFEGRPEECEPFLATMRERLQGPGSRRWSAALLNRISKWPVVAISSDGPVRLYSDGQVHPLYPFWEERSGPRGSARQREALGGEADVATAQ